MVNKKEFFREELKIIEYYESMEMYEQCELLWKAINKNLNPYAAKENS